MPGKSEDPGNEMAALGEAWNRVQVRPYMEAGTIQTNAYGLTFTFLQTDEECSALNFFHPGSTEKRKRFQAQS